MGIVKLRRYTTKGLKNALLAGICAGVLGSGAMAQVGGGRPQAPLQLKTDYFGYSAGVSARASYSDNIDLQSDDLKNGEAFLSSVLTGGAIISTPRVTGLALGDVTVSYLTEEGKFVVNQDVGATSTFTGVDDWLYLDVSGRTARQLVGENARYSHSLINARGQQANVHSYNISPYIFHRMDNQSSVEVRYRWSQVFVDDENSDYNPLSRGNYLNDSTTQEAFASYDSGGAAERVRFRLSAYGAKTEESGSSILPDFEYKQGSVFSDLQYALTTNFSLSGAIGYDEVETGGAASWFFDDKQLSGVFWRAGFTARPNRSSHVRLEYGRRYDDDFIDADMYYKLGRHMVVSASAGRVLQSGTQAANAEYHTAQILTLDYADKLREGASVSPREVISAANRFENILAGAGVQTVGVSVTNQAHVALSSSYNRTNLTLSANYRDSDYGFRQITSYGLNAQLNHRFSRQSSGYAGLSYRRSDSTFDTSVCVANPTVFGFDVTDPLFDAVSDCAAFANDNGVLNTLVGRIGAKRQLYKNASVFAEASHTQRFAENDRLEYSENLIMAGVTLDF